MSVRVAVLVSGAGTNLQALIDASRGASAAYEVVLVVSNRPGVPALERARTAGLESLVIDHRTFADREAFDHALDDALAARQVDLVALAGFMRLLGPAFVRRWSGRLVNVHPSLLPHHPGVRAVPAALASGDMQTGVSIHFVDEGIDTGPVIAQTSVPVLPGDDEGRLASRLRAVEHALYPRVVDLLARGEVRLVDGRVERTGGAS